MELTNDVLKQVLQDMVEDAINLYISAFVNYSMVINGERKLKHPDVLKRDCIDTMTEVSLFFCSDYGESLTGVDGKIVMETLNKRAKQAYKDNEIKKKYKSRRVVSVKPGFFQLEVKPCTKK